MLCGIAAASGDVAAWLTADLPVACAGISPKACYACQSLSSAAEISSCIVCAKEMTPDPLSLSPLYLGSGNLGKAETCASCYKTATDTARAA